MAASWHRRLVLALQRRRRILQGIARFYGGKLRDGAAALLRTPARRAALVAAMAATAGAILWWGMGRGATGPLAQGRPGLPVVPGIDVPLRQQLVAGQQLEEQYQLRSALPAAAAGRAGVTAQPAVPPDALPRPEAPAIGQARPGALLQGLAPPVDGPLVVGPGWRRHSVSGHWYYDPSVRLAAAPGSPVRAVLPGTVTQAGPDPDGGMRVAIDHGDQVTTVYGNLDHLLVPVGQHVSAHAPVGLAAQGPDGVEVRFAVYVDEEPIDPSSVMELP